MDVAPARQSVLSDFQFKLHLIPLHPQTPGVPSQLSLFYATSLEIYQIARWCRASPENTLSDLPVINDPKDLVLKDDGMALCLYDDTMKVWSTFRDWVPQWSEMGQRIASAIEKNPTIQDSWDTNVNDLGEGHQSLHNFREDAWAESDGSVRPVSSPFMLANTIDEEVKRLEAAFINLPCDEDDEVAQPPLSPLSDSGITTPPLSPCSLFESPDSLYSPSVLPRSPLQSPFSLELPLSLGEYQTISPNDIFSPLPLVEGDSANDAVMEEVQVPSTPIVPTQSLPEEMLDYCAETSPPPSPSPYPLPSRSPSSPVAGPSRSPLKRSRWLEIESGDESDEFMPQRHKKTRAGKRTKAGTVKRASAKFEGKGTRCDLCGMHLGRATDLPRHKASCRSNPERATRKNPCEFCGKMLPVRADAIKRHLASKTCRSKRKDDDDEDPLLSES